MEATSSSEASVDFERPTRRYIPQDWTVNKDAASIPDYIASNVTMILWIMDLKDMDWGDPDYFEVVPQFLAGLDENGDKLQSG
jgi:hypothetical protein